MSKKRRRILYLVRDVTLTKTMSAIAVIGTGYVGLTTAVCLAKLGHQVVGVDIDEAKVARLRSGEATIYEPGLEELMQETQKRGRLVFTSDYREGIPAADFVFIAVGTPPGRRGEADLVYVKQAAKAIAGAMKKSVTIVNKSTVPIGTGNIVARIVGENLRDEIPFHVVSNPEFLREGSAIHDFMNPDRLVFGSHDEPAARAVAGLYSKLDTRILITDLHTAEMIKYASNAFLATRISFINEMARICERVDADVKVVSEGMGMDRRIGPLFLDAGIGYGGSCFPKDVKALARMAETMGYHPELLDAVMEINLDQRTLVVEKLREVLGGLRGQVIGLLGLSYKPNTDDVREAPAIDVIENLLQKGAEVRAYDPKAMPVLKAQMNSIEYCKDSYAVASGADALLIVTEWDEFRQLDLDRIKGLMRRPVIVDGRNIFDPRAMRERGFVYRGVGRS
jgi:UDPglucose 6-dehydrogenase